jgi:hypothetical protein
LIKIIDNFLNKKDFDAIGETSMVYSKVFWIGRNAVPENPFHDLIHKIFRNEWPYGSCGISGIQGATAWWNIRPIDPKPHSDLISYCTSNGVDHTPKNPPTKTFIYYLRAPDNGGRLDIYSQPAVPNFHSGITWKSAETDSIAAIPNRLISFPIDYIHEVKPYAGNRVSIGVIFWNTLPSIYGETDSTINDSYDRPWTKEENEESNAKLTEDSIMGHPV